MRTLKILALVVVLCVAALLLYVLLAPQQESRTMESVEAAALLHC